MTRRLVALLLTAGAVLGACGGETSPSELRNEVLADLGTLHRSTIDEVPGLIALFYHHPDGWAVEDTSFDEGATWCRHAWYRWELTDVAAPDDFTIRYEPDVENPDCAPLGEPLVLDVDSRAEREGRTVYTGEYASQGLHAERTVCSGTIDDYADVCGVSSGLGPPSEARTG